MKKRTKKLFSVSEALEVAAQEMDKKAGKVIWVAAGILFPVSALSAFATQKSGRWILVKPELFRSHNGKPRVSGRSEATYDASGIYTETIASALASA